jgi:hypothetical protein
MTPIEYVTVAISAAAIVTRIVMFIRNPTVTTPTELWLADAPTELWMGEYANRRQPRKTPGCNTISTRPALAGRCFFVRRNITL